MIFKNITKKRDVKEKIFCTNQETFIIELREDIVQDLKKLTISTYVLHIHLQFHPHFANKNCLEQFSTTFFCRVVYYIVQYINYYAHMHRLRVFWLHQMCTRPPSSLYVSNATLLLLPLL
jgi:hypothetical protein